MSDENREDFCKKYNDRFIQDRAFNSCGLYDGRRAAATPEPMSKPGMSDVLPEVLKDFKARDAVGRLKYKTTLQTHNGRDPLNDALQEAMDLVMYLKQEAMNRSDVFAEKISEWADERGLSKCMTPYSQMNKLFEKVLKWYAEVEKCDSNADADADADAEMMEMGDIKVVLQNICNMRGYSFDDCGWMAYAKIKNSKTEG